MLLGGAIVVAAGIFIIFRERRLGHRARRRERKAARIDARSRRSAAVGDDLLLLLAELLHAELHHVAGLEEDRLGFLPWPTPGGVPVVTTSPGSSTILPER